MTKADWIRTDLATPPDGAWVLIVETHKYGSPSVLIARWRDGTWYQENGMDCPRVTGVVTHWMPLPELP